MVYVFIPLRKECLIHIPGILGVEPRLLPVLLGGGMGQYSWPIKKVMETVIPSVMNQRERDRHRIAPFRSNGDEGQEDDSMVGSSECN